MYYEQELTQADIARSLGVSRALVSNMIRRAKELGVVNIEIRSPFKGDKELLSKLKKRYGLIDGLIVPTNRSNVEFSLKSVVSQAALFVQKNIGPCHRIGIGWGDAVSQLVDLVNIGEKGTSVPRTLCPLIGSIPSTSSDWHPNEMARRLAERVGGQTLWLHAPAFPGSQKNLENFKATEEFQEVYKCWRNLDAAIVDIERYPNVPDQATAMRFGAALQEDKAVGGLLSYFYNISGILIEGESDYVIRIPLELLKKIKKVFLICSGDTIAQALLGALRMGIVTHLITDDAAAATLIEIDN
jgi:DNA-binding transcriptional regulator LsrR (DeoR family)